MGDVAVYRVGLTRNVVEQADVYVRAASQEAAEGAALAYAEASGDVSWEFSCVELDGEDLDISDVERCDVDDMDVDVDVPDEAVAPDWAV